MIDAELDPAAHTLKATAKVTFTATDTVSNAVFELHNALKVDSVEDAQKHQLIGERGPNATISVALPSPMSKGASTTLTFVYGGTLSGTEESPVEGLKVAAIGDPISYLLYAGRWFPMVGYLTDRFTAEIHVQVPSGYRVVGSGNTGSPHSDRCGGMQYSFNWTRPSFPGNDHRRQVQRADGRRRLSQCSYLCDRCAQAERSRICPDRQQGIRLFWRDFW